ncbi:MAG: hypothetical protein PVH19_01395 [Planctomycetia bacterium]|jgi:ribosomal protein S27E
MTYNDDQYDNSYDDYDDTYDEDESFDDASDTVECPACGATIYEDTPRCPICGEYITFSTSPFSGKPTWWIVLGLLGSVALVVALIFALF